MTRKGYLVTYSTGSYDTFFIQNDKVFFSKEKAEARCKELDFLHEPQESMFVKDRNEYGDLIQLSEEDQNKTYWACEYEADTYRDEHPEEFPDPDDVLGTKYADDSENWNKIWQANEDHYKDILWACVKKRYPEWTDEMIRHAVAIEEGNENIQQEEYGSADIEEIYIDVDE